MRVNCLSLISLQDSVSLPTYKAPSRCLWKGFDCQTQSKKLCLYGAVPLSHQQLLALPWNEAELNPWSAEPLHLGFPSFHPPALHSAQWQEESSREVRQLRMLEGRSQPPVMLGMHQKAGSQEKHCLLSSLGWGEGRESRRKRETKQRASGVKRLEPSAHEL